MPTKTIDCKLKGCKLIWACINEVTGEPEPIGCVNSATHNTTEQDGENTGKFGGTYSNDQTTPLQTTTDANGDTVLADNETRFEINGEFYDGCSANSSSCQHELNLTIDYCFQRDCEGSGTDSAANQRKLECGSVQPIGLFRLNANGSLTELFRLADAKIGNKNRTFSTGQNTDHTFDISITGTDYTPSACYH